MTKNYTAYNKEEGVFKKPIFFSQIVWTLRDLCGIVLCYDDAPEENNEYAEPQTCEGDGIRLYFRAVGEPWFESRKIKIRLS